jgi:predicted nucleic acid-binding protein
MAIKVLDSWALIAFFEDEPAAEQVETLLMKADGGTHRLLLCAVNWGEIYYNTMREISQAAAEKTAKEIAGLPIEIVGVDGHNLELVRQAAVYKATRKLSYADAFAAALAKITDAELVTGDREFREVEDEIKIALLGGFGKRA